MHQSLDRMQDAFVDGDGEIVEVLAERSGKQKLQSSSLFDSPVARSSNYEEAAVARLSQILPPLSFTPRPRIKFQCNSCSALDDASERRDLSKRSYSFPVLRSMQHLRFSPPESPISGAISHPPWDLDIWQQQQQQQQEQEEEEDEIVEVPTIPAPCRRSKSLRELFDAEKLQGSGDFPARNDGFFSAKPDFFFDVNRLSPISRHAALRSSSSGRVTLHELLHSEAEDSPQSRKLRSKPKRRRTLSLKLSIQSIRAKSKEKKHQKDGNSKKRETQKTQTAILSKSDVNSQKLKGPQIEILSQADANSIHKEELSKLHKATFPKADYKIETQQTAKLQRASSQARKSRPISRDSGWGKLEVKPPAAMPPLQLARSGSSQAALSRQVSTHEQYYISRKTARVRQRKKTNLPYRENLISFCCCSPAQSSSIP